MNTLLTFYSVHQNVGALALLILLLVLFLVTKKNYKLCIPVVILFFVLNIFCFKLTDGKTWTRTFYASDDVPKAMLIYEKRVDSIPVIEFKDTLEVSFAVSDKTPWVVKTQAQNASVRLLHWCWLDDYWEKFSQTDLVAAIWGENSGKKIRGSSEARLNYAGE